MTDTPHEMDPDLESPPMKGQGLLAVIFGVIMTGGMVDLILDRPTTLFSAHVLFEVGMVVVSLGAATYLARGWFRAQRATRRLERAVDRTTAERDAWRDRASRALTGLGQAISHQFDQWELTPAERETALMLLKGYSTKRIGRESGRSERTVRQHAVAVYRKSGLAGRAELAGFFLGDVQDAPVAGDESPLPGAEEQGEATEAGSGSG